ncbi:MAG: sigma-54 dependent transcriptional regulator [Rhodospirillales bacterium]
MPDRKSILIIEDDLALTQIYKDYLRAEPYDVDIALTGTEGIELARELDPDAIVLDMRLPDMSGFEVLKEARRDNWRAGIVVVTAHGTVDVAVSAMQAGAADFLTKPFDDERLIVTVRNCLERQELTDLVRTYRDRFDRDGFAGFIGGSLPMQEVYRIIESAAPSNASVFITGESGTGKELCAEALHGHGTRSDRPFIAINCGAIPHELMESEIFGHVKGAFTGALAEREGAARRANGGTLFLDEVCEMDPDLQVKLLRFVQTGQFQKVGGNVTESVDVRFIAATNRDPLFEVEAGRFREDLFYRLHVIPISMPPLRDRGADIARLAETFLLQAAEAEGKKFRAIDEDAQKLITEYPWPGNVRQMENVIRNAVVLGRGPTLTGAMIEPALKLETRSEPVATPKSTGTSRPAIRPLHEIEMEAIDDAIRVCDGNVTRAAAHLEISPATVYRRLKARQSG